MNSHWIEGEGGNRAEKVFNFFELLPRYVKETQKYWRP